MLTKHVLLGCALRLLLLPLQLEIELLLALHCRKKSKQKVHKNIRNGKTGGSCTDQPSDESHTCHKEGQRICLTMPEGKRYPPISVSTGDAKAQCAREVKPEPLPEFSGDRCDGHCDME
jgi:hypothetical protein